MIQGWAVVDNTQDEDWENVQPSLIAGLPVSFVHDLYTPRYIRRPVVKVKETTGVLPPELEEGFGILADADPSPSPEPAHLPLLRKFEQQKPTKVRTRKRFTSFNLREEFAAGSRGGPSSMPTQTRKRQLGDLFEYEIEHRVTIRRNQSALVPIVLRPFEGKPVLLYNKQARAANPIVASNSKTPPASHWKVARHGARRRHVCRRGHARNHQAGRQTPRALRGGIRASPCSTTSNRTATPCIASSFATAHSGRTTCR